jgi:hypothetical protein
MNKVGQSILITVGGLHLRAELNDTSTAQQILARLPLAAAANVWGDEIYFAIPVTLPVAADAQEEVAVGTLAYWPPGHAFCIFYGPTPVSRGVEPRAYSPVNVIGHVLDDATQLRTVRNGAAVQIKRLEEPR